MTAPVVELNGVSVLRLSLYMPVSGAWTAEAQVASSSPVDPGAEASITIGESAPLVGRVVRAGVEAERLYVRVAGGTVDWQSPVEVKHYRETTVGQVTRDLGLELDAQDDTELDFWTRGRGTVGGAVTSLARHLGFSWRVNPDGTVRMRAETPGAPTVDARAVETSRHPGRGLVEVAPENGAIVPGVQHGQDAVGEVVYELRDVFRCRYYTEARGALRGKLEAVIRWVMRDTIYLGTYTAEVASQAADGTLDLLPDDDRLKAEGLQGVPIRHGLPGVTVAVPAGERVLLGFDGGDPDKPFAALWHEGQVTAVNVGGTDKVAMAPLVNERIDALQQAFDAHIHPTSMGPSGTPTQPVGQLETVESEVLHTR